jgi:hypothetical protein
MSIRTCKKNRRGYVYRQSQAIGRWLKQTGKTTFQWKEVPDDLKDRKVLLNGSRRGYFVPVGKDQDLVKIWAMSPVVEVDE